MKNLLLIIFLIQMVEWCPAQCPDVLTINRPEDIQTFWATYPECRELKKLHIEGVVYDVDDLAPLDIVHEFKLFNTSFDSLILADLFEVTQVIWIRQNLRLEYADLSLPNVQSAVVLNIEYNKKLTHCLFDINKLNTSILHTEKDMLVEVKRPISVNNLSVFGNIGFIGNTVKVVESIRIGDDSFYKSFAALIGQLNVDFLDYFSVFNVPEWSAEGIDQIKGVERYFFSYIDEFKTDGFLKIDEMTFGLGINDCTNLTHLNHFHKAKLNSLSLYKNPMLTSLEGLNFTDTVSGLNIVNNVNLSNIEALKGIKRIDDQLSIEHNPALEFCSYRPICQKLIDDPFSVSIIGNYGICAGENDVLDNCLVNTWDENLDHNFQVFQNGSESLIIQFDEVAIKRPNLSIYDLTGRLLISIDDCFSGQTVSTTLAHPISVIAVLTGKNGIRARTILSIF